MGTAIVERSILYYTNRERRRRKLRGLKGHRGLIRAARGHSRWMARTGVYGHYGAHGSSHIDRAQRQGYGSGVSENIWKAPSLRGKGGTWKSKFQWNSDWSLGKAAVISWMNSPGHRANLLGSDWYHIGIGVARSKRGTYYLTQNFGDENSAQAEFTWRMLGWLAVALAIAALWILSAD